MGVDKAIHVEIPEKEYRNLQPLHIAKILAKVAQEEKADLLIVGKQVTFCSITTQIYIYLAVSGVNVDTPCINAANENYFIFTLYVYIAILVY